MNHLEAISFTQKLLEEHNINYSVKIIHATKFLGRCTYSQPNHDGYIEISLPHLNQSNDEQIIDTLKHEVAHAIRWENYREIPFDKQIVHGKTINIGHDRKWKEIAEELGAIPKACVPVKLHKKYRFICSSCGYWSSRQTKIKSGKRYMCPKCESVLTFERDLVYTKSQNPDIGRIL